MNKVNILLLPALVLALMVSCLVLVRTAYESRQVYTALDRAKREHLQLDAEHARLAAERQTQATHQKVGRVAAERLKMTAPVATLYVDAPGTAGGASTQDHRTASGANTLNQGTATAALSTRGAR